MRQWPAKIVGDVGGDLAHALHQLGGAVHHPIEGSGELVEVRLRPGRRGDPHFAFPGAVPLDGQRHGVHPPKGAAADQGARDQAQRGRQGRDTRHGPQQGVVGPLPLAQVLAHGRQQAFVETLGQGSHHFGLVPGFIALDEPPGGPTGPEVQRRQVAGQACAPGVLHPELPDAGVALARFDGRPQRGEAAVIGNDPQVGHLLGDLRVHRLSLVATHHQQGQDAGQGEGHEEKQRLEHRQAEAGRPEQAASPHRSGIPRRAPCGSDPPRSPTAACFAGG